MPETLCGRTIYYNGRLLANYIEIWPEYVDCHVCLYHLGLYVPLSRLAEHQQYWRQRLDVVIPERIITRCPECNGRHFDAPCGDWKNPPHKTHLCNFCGALWRPFAWPTEGV